MSGKRRRVSNPLALAVLATLRQQPMHPYEMAATMRSQGKERSIKLNYGSLYTVVDNLARHGLIEAMEATREGRRPERTVYRLTDAGRAELEDWLTELLGAPVKEYPQFEAALALMSVLTPGQVLEALRDRVLALEQALSDERAELARYPWLPRLFVIESEYHLLTQEAELAWVRGIVSRARGRLVARSWPSGRTGTAPAIPTSTSPPWRSPPWTETMSADGAGGISDRSQRAARGAAELTNDENRPPARCGNT